MNTPICNVLSLALPLLAAAAGLYIIKTAKGATNMGAAIAPLAILLMALTAAAFIGELAALASLWRGERLRWLSWLGIIVNGVLLLPLVYLALTADWR